MTNKIIENLQMSGLAINDAGNFNLFITEQSGIFIPPAVEIDGMILHFPPVPDNLHAYNHRNHLLYWLQQNGWKKANRINNEKMFIDFLNLAETHPYQLDSIEKFRKFALAYGPLWEGTYRPPQIQKLIANNIRTGRQTMKLFGKEFRKQFRSTKPPKKYSPLKPKCDGHLARIKPKQPVHLKRNRLALPSWYKPGTWYGYENIFNWYDTALEIEAIFEIALTLRKNEKASEEKWMTIKFEDASEFDIMVQRQLLAGIINAKLKQFISLQVSLEDGNFRTHIDTGLGFIGALWLHVAQILTKNLMLCTCDGCGQPYIRTGRKPQAGRLNFCEDCGQGDKASKRLYAQKKTNKKK